MLLVKKTSLDESHDVAEPEALVSDGDVFLTKKDIIGGEGASSAQHTVLSTSSISPISQSIISLAGAAFDGMVIILFFFAVMNS